MNREVLQKGKLASQPYEDRSVGCPLGPDLSAMTKEELKTRRGTLERLREFTKKAEKGDKKPVPEIQDILQESPELAWRYMDYGKLAEWHLIERMTKDKDFASKEVLTRELAAMREEIAGENPSHFREAACREGSSNLVTGTALRGSLRGRHVPKYERQTGELPTETAGPGAQEPSVGNPHAGTDPQDGASGPDQHSGEADQHGRLADPVIALAESGFVGSLPVYL